MADTGNNRIVRMDDMTGTGWTTLGTSGTGINQFRYPRRIFVDRARRIYVTDYGTGRIVRVNDMTGAGWTTLGCGYVGDSLSCPEITWFRGPVGIFVDKAGRIYVADSDNDRIVRTNDMNGAGWVILSAFIRGGIAYHYYLPQGIFVDGAGRIFVADSGNNRIVRMNNMTGAGSTTFGTPGSWFNQFQNPAGIFVDDAGRIYVADTKNNRVVKVDDMTGTGWTTLGGLN